MWLQVMPNCSLLPEVRPTLLSDKHNILSLLCSLFILLPLFSRKSLLFKIHMLQTLALHLRSPNQHNTLSLSLISYSSQDLYRTYANAMAKIETLTRATSDVWKQLLASLCFKQYVPNFTCSLHSWLLFCFS